MTHNDMTVAPTYRVLAPMIQIVCDYRTLKNAPLDRQFRVGDVLPAWVPDEEIRRLHDLGFIEVSA
jgi:hypothetical protein